jgi:hypothetical protein
MDILVSSGHEKAMVSTLAEEQCALEARNDMLLLRNITLPNTTITLPYWETLGGDKLFNGVILKVHQILKKIP